MRLAAVKEGANAAGVALPPWLCWAGLLQELYQVTE